MRCHGFYPHVADMVTVAFRNANVFVSPDMDTFAPGGGLHVEAANGFMKDQFLFGASFPFRPMGQGVADFRGLGLSGEALEAALRRNADRLLGLGLGLGLAAQGRPRLEGSGTLRGRRPRVGAPPRHPAGGLSPLGSRVRPRAPG